MRHFISAILVLGFLGCGSSAAEMRIKNECSENKRSYEKAAFICRAEDKYTFINKHYYCEYARRYERFCRGYR